MIIVIIIGFIALVTLIAVPLLVLSHINIAKAKKEARIIMDGGAERNAKRIRGIKQVLSAANNDVEATYLWHELEKLNS